MSRHNSSYWHDTPYIGVGAAAHSYDGKTRSWNTASLDDYISSIEDGIRPCEYETIDAETHYNDLITTALRTREGLQLEHLSPEDRQFALDAARPHIGRGLLAVDDDRLHLTRSGIYLSDSIMSDLMRI